MTLHPKLQSLISDLEMGLKTTILKSSFNQSNNYVESHLGGSPIVMYSLYIIII